MMIETDWIKKVIRDYWKTILSANIKPSDFCHLHMSAKSFFINIGLWLFPQIKLIKFCPSIPITLPFYIFCQISTQGLKVRLTGSALLLWSIGNSKNNSGDLAGEPFGKTLFLFYQEFTQPDNPFTRTYLSNPWFFGQSWLDVLNFMLIFFFAFFTFSSGLVFSAKLYQVAEIVVKHLR